MTDTDYADDFESTEWVECEQCHGTGTILVCCDDICHGLGYCIHGDGDEMCPACQGEGELYAGGDAR